MNLTLSPHAQALHDQMREFLRDHVLPAEQKLEQQRAASSDPYFYPPVMEELKSEARRRGLWNLHLPDRKWGAGLTNVEYAPIAELSGHSKDIAPEAMNGSAPDSGNMEILAGFATPAIQDRFLKPLLEGEIRSAFAMTEPGVASSDATNITTRIERAGDAYRIDGRKWWISGAASPRCPFAIVMGVSNPDADRHHRHSMIVVPLDTPGVEIVRTLPVYGYDHTGYGSHVEISFDDVRVPAGHLLGEEGGGFDIAQARLGPGRIHHCMRLLGMAERALAAMCQRAYERRPFGRPLAEQSLIRSWIADSRVKIEQNRLLVMKTAWLMDTVGNRDARMEISAIKIAVPRDVTWIIDRAIQVHGAAGVSADTPLAEYYTYARTVQIADGPDEVHQMALARQELAKWAPA